MRNKPAFLCLVIGLLTACHQIDVDSSQQLQILKASVPTDSATTFNIDHTTGTITVYPAPPKPNWVRGNLMTINFQTSPNTVLAPLNSTDTQPLNKQVLLDVLDYDNSKPIRMVVRDQNSSNSLYKAYQLQLKAAGPVRFESMPALKDTMMISLKNYEIYLVKLPIRNLYDGHPQDYRVYATLAGSTAPIELTLGHDKYSQDFVLFYFDKQQAKDGIYTIELRKADGQRIISPTRILVNNSR